jgi:hypothetical protein
MSEAMGSYTEYYWRVTPENVCGEGTAAEGSFKTYLVPPILLVDDDDDNPDVLGYYTSTLEGLGASYDVWDTGSGNEEPGESDLANYAAVIWFTGDKSNNTTGPGEAGETALANWLDGGGCFFLSSQDYLWRKTPDEFTSTYLGLGDHEDDVGHLSVTGAGSVFGGLGPYGLSYPFTNYSDEVMPNESAEVGFESTQGSGGIVKEGETFKSTFWGFPFEAMSESGREESMGAVLEWCLSYGMEMSGEHSQRGNPGETITYTMTLTNTGVTDVISLSVSGGVWTTTLSESSVQLEGGERVEVEVYVEIPADAEAGDEDVVTVTAQSGGDPLVSASVELTTTVPLDEHRIYLPLVTR